MSTLKNNAYEKKKTKKTKTKQKIIIQSDGHFVFSLQELR